MRVRKPFRCEESFGDAPARSLALIGFSSRVNDGTRRRRRWVIFDFKSRGDYQWPAAQYRKIEREFKKASGDTGDFKFYTSRNYYRFVGFDDIVRENYRRISISARYLKIYKCEIRHLSDLHYKNTHAASLNVISATAFVTGPEPHIARGVFKK